MKRGRKAKKVKKSSKLDSIRRIWTRNPTQQAHSTRKGKRGYSRKENRSIERKHNDDN